MLLSYWSIHLCFAQVHSATRSHIRIRCAHTHVLTRFLSIHIFFSYKITCLLGGSSGESVLLGVLDDGLDDTLGLEVSESNSGKRTSNLESVNKHGDRDELEGGGLLEDSVVEGLIKDNVVLSLILHLLGGPLLLSGLSSGHGGGGLSGLGLLHFRGHWVRMIRVCRITTNMS